MATTMNFASDMDISPVAVAGEGLEKFVQHVEGLRMVNSNGDSGKARKVKNRYYSVLCVDETIEKVV